MPSGLLYVRERMGTWIGMIAKRAFHASPALLLPFVPVPIL